MSANRPTQYKMKTAEEKAAAAAAKNARHLEYAEKAAKASMTGKAMKRGRGRPSYNRIPHIPEKPNNENQAPTAPSTAAATTTALNGVATQAAPTPALPVNSSSTPSLMPQQQNQPRTRQASHTPPVPGLSSGSSSRKSSLSNSPEYLKKMQSQGQQGQGTGGMPLADKASGFQIIQQQPQQQQGQQQCSLVPSTVHVGIQGQGQMAQNQLQQGQMQQAPASLQQMMSWGANSVGNGGNAAANFGTLARTGPLAATANNVATINPAPINMGPGSMGPCNASKRRREGCGMSSCKRQRRNQGGQTWVQPCQPQIQQQPQQQTQQQTQPQLYQQQQQQPLPLYPVGLETLDFCMASNNNNNNYNNNSMPTSINPSLPTLPQGQTQPVPAVDWGLENIDFSTALAANALANNMPPLINPSLLTLPQGQMQLVPALNWSLENISFSAEPAVDPPANIMPPSMNPFLLPLPQGQAQPAPSLNCGIQDIDLSAEPDINAPANNNNFDGLPMDDLVAQMTGIYEGMFAAPDAGTAVGFSCGMPAMDQGLSGSGSLPLLPTQAATQPNNVPVVDKVTLDPGTLFFPLAGPQDTKETQSELRDIQDMLCAPDFV